MKKITLFLSILSLIFVSSCQDKNAYTIEGNFTENTFEGKMIYLQLIDSAQIEHPRVVDSVVLKDSKFSFKGITNDKLAMGIISVGKLEQPEKDSPIGSLILEPGTIKITFDKDAVNTEGTTRNNEFNEIHNVMNKMSALYMEVDKAGGPAAVPLDANGMDASARMQKLQEEQQKAIFGFLKSNMNNAVGEFLFYSYMTSLTREQLKELIALAGDSFRNQPNMQTLEKELNKAVPQAGQPFTDVQLEDKDGKTIALSAYAGKSKCVLIDFWASWCGPCIQEMPNLQKTYATYKSKGLEIVGVSVDEDKQAWLDAVKKLNINWVQLVDANGFASEAYDIQSIPHTILLDQNGSIVAIGLRGKDLDNKIEELLK